jgi:hypothetical protein
VTEDPSSNDGELSRRGNIQHADLAHGNTIENEVKVDLDVFGALILDGVRGHRQR